MNFASWRSSLTAYSYRDVASAHVDAVLEAFNGLIPKPDSFSNFALLIPEYENGMVAKLLSLYGTLEITYKNKSYNIPICIWLPLNYPNSAPMIYIKPTPNMLIRTSKYVDSMGKVYHPQLAYWKQDSSLLLFLRVLQQIFSLEPPVYSRPPNTNPANTNPSGSGSSPSYGASASSNQSTTTPSYNKQQGFPIKSVNHPSKTPPPSQSDWRPSRNVQVANPREEEINNLRAKLTERINEKSVVFYQMLDQASQEQISINRKLMASQEEIDTSLKQLNLSCSNLRQNIQSLMDINEKLLEAIKITQNTPDPDISLIAESQPALHKQIFDAAAEARALDDCIYHMKNSFSTENMDINLFIKNLKSLAREEFFKKALILKIRSHLGLKSEL